MLDADRKDFIMFATKNKYAKNEPDKIYTIKGVEIVTLANGAKDNLVKIRDYNNSLMLKGDYSKSWNGWTPELKSQVDFDKQEENVHFMNFNTLKFIFKKICISFYQDMFKFSHICIEENNSKFDVI